MKKLSRCFKVHPITFIYFLIALQVGYFKNYLIIFSIVLFHEMCHLLMAYFFNFKLGKMTLLPFGAYLEIMYYGNYHVLKELIVSIMGPLSHIIIWAALLYLKPYLGAGTFHYALQFNFLMLLFNLLPLYPLDGSKVVLIGLSFIFPYKLTLYLTGILSVLCLILLCGYYIGVEVLLIYAYLWLQQILYFRRIGEIYTQLLMLRNQFVHYKHIKWNKGYSIYRPYFNIYLKKEE